MVPMSSLRIVAAARFVRARLSAEQLCERPASPKSGRLDRAKERRHSCVKSRRNNRRRGYVGIGRRDDNLRGGWAINARAANWGQRCGGRSLQVYPRREHSARVEAGA